MSAAAEYMAERIERTEGMAARPQPAPPSPLVTSIRILIEAQQAAEAARAEHVAAGQKWAAAMATVQLAQQACALDMPNGREPVTLRISGTHVATIARVGKGVTVTASRLLAGRAGA